MRYCTHVHLTRTKKNYDINKNKFVLMQNMYSLKRIINKITWTNVGLFLFLFLLLLFFFVLGTFAPSFKNIFISMTVNVCMYNTFWIYLILIDGFSRGPKFCISQLILIYLTSDWDISTNHIGPCLLFAFTPEIFTTVYSFYCIIFD